MRETEKLTPRNRIPKVFIGPDYDEPPKTVSKLHKPAHGGRINNREPNGPLLKMFRDMDRYQMAEVQGMNKARELELALLIMYQQRKRDAYKIIFINPFIRLKNFFINLLSGRKNGK